MDGTPKADCIVFEEREQQYPETNSRRGEERDEMQVLGVREIEKSKST